MDVLREDNRLCVKGQGISVCLPDTAANRKVLLVLLRWLQDASTGRRLFTLQELAQIVQSENRQAASEHVEQFRACGEDFEGFLNRKRKVDEQVVEGVYEELVADPLASQGVLCQRVGLRLGRTDLSEANIAAALEQIPVSRIRPILKRQLEAACGGVQYREQALIEDLLAHIEAQEAPKAGLSIQPEAPDEVLSDPTAMRKLIQPGTRLDQISPGLIGLCQCLAFYFWGVPLSRLGMWTGLHKSTIWRGLTSLGVLLYEVIYHEIRTRIRLGVVVVDEKWIKIKGQWYYWFVVLDEVTQIPVFTYLAASRSANVCQWIGLQIRPMATHLKAIVTDGLASYAHLLPGVPHMLCHFHHQQGVTAWLKTHLSDSPKLAFLKTQMKRLLQTHDKRTLRRRMQKLEAHAQEWGICGWVEQTKARLTQLLPAVGSRVLPRTTNMIERFFRNFQRFYKVRRGFHSKKTAIQQLALFTIGYLFSKRAKDGIAPIEAIWPEAAQTPLYQILNDPFGVHRRLESVKESPKMADPACLLRPAA